MNVIWSRPEPIKPADIIKALSDNHAYTTVSTVLNRMVDKKLITRSLKGNVYYYQAVQDKKTFAAAHLDDLFQRLFNSYGSAVVTSFRRIAKLQKSRS